jgi:hypothetical protein
MFGREDQTQAKHEKNRAITRKISYVGVITIAINFVIYIINYSIYRRITGDYSKALSKWTTIIIPSMFLLICCLLLLISLVWICHSLRYDK